MKAKTARLCGPALDWAIGQITQVPLNPPQRGQMVLRTTNLLEYSPTLDGTLYCHIANREGICTKLGHSGIWLGYFLDLNDNEQHMCVGYKMQEAGLRAYAVRHFGEEVEIPDELKEWAI